MLFQNDVSYPCKCGSAEHTEKYFRPGWCVWGIKQSGDTAKNNGSKCDLWEVEEVTSHFLLSCFRTFLLLFLRDHGLSCFPMRKDNNKIGCIQILMRKKRYGAQGFPMFGNDIGKMGTELGKQDKPFMGACHWDARRWLCTLAGGFAVLIRYGVCGWGRRCMAVGFQ